MPSAYAAMRVLTPDDTLVLDGTVGGIGGCPYCGTGRATGMMATEDLFHMLEGMGIETGVDVSKLIDCAWLLEEIIGRPTFGAVSKAGPAPGVLRVVVRPQHALRGDARTGQALQARPRLLRRRHLPLARTDPQSAAPGYDIEDRASQRRTAVISTLFVEAFGQLSRHANLKGMILEDEEDLHSVFRERAQLMRWGGHVPRPSADLMGDGRSGDDRRG